ncbi:MATE family efflux transporter [Falsigemmobacter intermedius]|uniref:Multidrug-efflux transporter n=2 Tax=Falsigemmobacter intermedius TaxID=1553448 RepID=A0A3S3UF29_9RHOB|nr:MATE family efflux transporter [Falsigemmobacter intermedius]
MSFPAHVRALLILALPLIGSHVAQVILHVTNTVMLGWYSVEALAGGVLGASTFFIMFLLGAGFAAAVMPLAAEALGRGDETQVRRATRMGMWLSIGFSVLIYPVFWFSYEILMLLGQKHEVAQNAQAFMRVTGLGMAPALLVMVMKSFLAAQGRAQIVLWVTVAAAFVNAGLNWLFIFGNYGLPELGIQGAALSSVTVQSLSFLAIALWAGFHSKIRHFKLFQRFWRADPGALSQVFRLGWPIGFTSLMEGGLFNAAALMMGWIGTVELAAHGIALEITSLTFMIHVGLANAATVRVGLAQGAGDARALRDGAWTALAVSQSIGLFIIAAFLIFPELLIGLFLDEANPRAAEIIAYGSVLLMMSALFQVADAAQAVSLGLLRGIQDTRVPMYIAAITYWGIGIPASYLLAFKAGLGGPGIWLGLVIGLSLTAVCLIWRFRKSAPRP